MARATISLPVPVSPLISTVAEVGGHRLDHLVERLHRRTLADHRAQSEALIELLPQVGVLVLQTLLLAGAVDDEQQLVELKGLGDEIGGAAFDDVDGVLDRRVAGDDNRQNPGVSFERGVDHLPSVEPRQSQVGNQDVEGKALQ